MPFITEGKTNFKYILIIIILAAIVGGGILAYQYWWLPRQEMKSLEVKPSEEAIASPELNLKTTKLATIPEGYELKYFIFSPDGRQVVSVLDKEGKEFVMVNEIIGKAYDEIGYINFSPDSKRIIYSAKEKEKWSLVLDGQEGRPYDDIYNPFFSPDSKRLVYEAKDRKAKKEILVVGEKESKPYDAINSFEFSPDSKQVAYEAVEGNKNFVVVGEKEGKVYDAIWTSEPRYYSSFTSGSNSFFAPESNQIAYLASDGDNWFLVVGEEEKKIYSGEPDCFTFSPDGKQIAYRIMVEEEKYFIVVEGQEGKPYDWVSCPVFNSDSKQIAYTAMNFIGGSEEDLSYPEGDLSPSEELEWMAKSLELTDKGQCFLIINNKEGKPYDCSRNLHSDSFSETKNMPVFSSDSKQIAYRILNVDYSSYSQMSSISEEEPPGKCLVIVGDKEGEEHVYYPEEPGGLISNYCIPLLNQDGSQVAYWLRKGDKELIVLNEKEGKTYDHVYFPFFSPDGKKLTYMAQQGEKWFIVTGEKESKPYGEIFYFTFTPDSKYIAYGARDGNELWWIVEPVE